MFICVLVICLVTYKGIQNVLFTTLTGINKSIYLWPFSALQMTDVVIYKAKTTIKLQI